MGKFDLFWNTMKLCNWDATLDDERILEPVIEHLSTLDNEKIFEFHNLMTELLYDLDSKKLFDKFAKVSECESVDLFLYARCVALINGKSYYKKVKSGKIVEVWEMEFESLLYVPSEAWAMKNHSECEEYPHITKHSYETGSNKAMWK